MRFYFFVFALSLFLYLPCVVHAACASGGVCTDTGSAWSCPIKGNGGSGTWQYYCAGGGDNATMKTSASCSSSGSGTCDCGAVDTGSPCAGCGYQGVLRQGGYCWSNNSCSSACSGIPEFPEELGFLNVLGGLVVCGLFAKIKSRRRSAVLR